MCGISGLFLCFLGFACHFLNFDLKVGVSLAHLLPFPSQPPLPRSTTDKGVFCKVGCLVSNGGRNCCGNEFFLPALVLSGI